MAERQNRRYTKQTKVTTTIAAAMSSNLAVSQATGIPESNIRRWRDDPELAKYGEKARDELAEGATMLAHRALELISASLPNFEPRDLTILFGVLVDKAQLLSGGATSRNELRDISGTLSDLDIADTIRAAEDYARAGDPGTAEAAAPEAAG
jgi:hypothetical protein